MSSFATPELIQSIFGDALSKYTSSLLCKVCLDYGLDFKELSAKYMDSPEALSFFTTSQTREVVKEPKKKAVKKPREPKAEKEPEKPCSGLTSKGGPCKFKAMTGSDLCGIHQRKAEGVKAEKKPKVETEKKSKKSPKAKKTEPKHEHPIGDKSDECELCESHGDVVEPQLTESTFEATVQDGADIRAKLQAILSEEDDEEPEPEPEQKTEEPKPEPKEPEQKTEEPKEPEQKTEEPKPEPKEPETIQRKGGFIRPKVRGKRAATAPVSSVAENAAKAGPSEPKVEEEMDIRSKLRAVMKATHTDSEDEEEDFDEDVQERLRQKLASKFEEDEEDVDLDQFCDSPHSQHILREAWADMEEEEENL